jgi:hypothetical protein
MQPGGSFPVTPRKYSVDRARNKRPSDNRFQWRLCQEGQRYGARDAKQLAYWARKDAEKPSDAEAQRVNAGRARGSAAEAIATIQAPLLPWKRSSPIAAVSPPHPALGERFFADGRRAAFPAVQRKASPGSRTESETIVQPALCCACPISRSKG